MGSVPAAQLEGAQDRLPLQFPEGKALLDTGAAMAASVRGLLFVQQNVVGQNDAFPCQNDSSLQNIIQFPNVSGEIPCLSFLRASLTQCRC